MDIMRVQQLRNILMDLVKDGKHPDENASQQIKLGGDAGINMVDGTADFTVVDKVTQIVRMHENDTSRSLPNSSTLWLQC